MEMDNNTRINQIMQALQMREESEGSTYPGQKVYTPTVTGEDRIALITELVRLLTTVA